MTPRWFRVSKHRQCSVCAHDSWCTYNDKWHCCMRIASEKPTKNGGWLHAVDGSIATIPTSKEPLVVPPPFDAEFWWESKLHTVDVFRLEPRAKAMGLPVESLHMIGAVPHCDYTAFPMRNAKGKIIGIRIRSDEGKKWAITGSRQGIFTMTCYDLQDDDPTHGVVLEGPTDTAAAAMMGLRPIGRPSCLGCEDTVCDYASNHGMTHLTIVADADGPGIDGAKKLADHARSKGKTIRVVTCSGHKDLRAWFIDGATMTIALYTWNNSNKWMTP